MSNNVDCLGCGNDLMRMVGPSEMITMLKHTRATTGMVCACCSHIQLVTTTCPGHEGEVMLAELTPKLMGKLEREVIYHMTSLAAQIAINKAVVKSKAAC